MFFFFFLKFQNMLRKKVQLGFGTESVSWSLSLMALYLHWLSVHHKANTRSVKWTPVKIHSQLIIKLQTEELLKKEKVPGGF